MRNVGTHVNNFREIYSCCYFLVQPRGVFEPGRKHCSVWLHLNLNEAATDMKTEFCCTWTWLHSDLFTFLSERRQHVWLHFYLKEATTDIENRVLLHLNLNLVALEHEGGNRIWLHSIFQVKGGNKQIGCTLIFSPFQVKGGNNR